MSVSPGPNICVIGCGHWGKNLARNFAKLGHLYAVCENDAARLEVFREQYGVKGFLKLV
jgi:predicted dehydrogenase